MTRAWILGACLLHGVSVQTVTAEDVETNADAMAETRQHESKRERMMREIAALREFDGVLTPWSDPRPHQTMANREAPVPPQCYTRTQGFHNPCYVCHQAPRDGFENIQDDSGLQAAYEFSDVGFTNHWSNLFEDRRARAAAITDAEITAWVRQDNYSELAGRLRAAEFNGWIPDLEGLADADGAFDEEGFARDGSRWIALNYKPMPSTFWPTNGATDDVMIRLPEPFRSTREGAYSRDVYLANLALLELSIKKLDRVTTFPIDERAVGLDLDGDGALETATSVQRRATFVGGAIDHDVLDTMYPQGTEFLHTVRYLDLADDGRIIPSTRMKEVRYMRRARERRRTWAAYHYLEERLDKEAGKLPRAFPKPDRRSVESETGWELSGFVENANGRLRANTFEETMFCLGCHNSIGSTIDKTFSFPRKRDGADGWGYITLHGMPDAPNMGETMGEIETYLSRVGGGSEFRNNAEMASRWFTSDGLVDHDRVRQAKDVYELLAPSPRRALELNKAYRVIVADQDYVFGRVLEPPANVYDVVDPATAPTLPESRIFTWDIRLDWSAARPAAADEE